jgi:hypothetical protein
MVTYPGAIETGWLKFVSFAWEEESEFPVIVIGEVVPLKILITVSFICPFASEPKLTVSGTKSPPAPAFELGEDGELQPVSIEDAIVAAPRRNINVRVIKPND